jgi:hypothetical protein
LQKNFTRKNTQAKSGLTTSKFILKKKDLNIDKRIITHSYSQVRNKRKIKEVIKNKQALEKEVCYEKILYKFNQQQKR